MFRREHPVELLAKGALDFTQIVGGLQIEPVPWVYLEKPTEARRGVGGDGAPAGEDFTQTALRDAGRLGGGQLGDAQRREKFVAQNTAGVGQGVGLLMVVSLMIISDFNVLGIGSGPDETDAPLVVDADAMLAGAAALQWFEPVAGRESQEGEFHRSVDEL